MRTVLVCNGYCTVVETLVTFYFQCRGVTVTLTFFWQKCRFMTAAIFSCFCTEMLCFFDTDSDSAVDVKGHCFFVNYKTGFVHLQLQCHH